MIMEKPPGSTIVLQSFIIVLICLTTCDSASWLQKKEHDYHFQIGDVIGINCTLRDPRIKVTLWKSDKFSGSKKLNYSQVVPNGRHVQQFNQTFRLINLTLSDHGQYQCRAENIASLNVLAVQISNDSASWLQKKEHNYHFQIGDVIGINCTLSDSRIKVTLWKSDKFSGSKKLNYSQVVPNGRHVQQFNQTFRLINLTLSDHGQYQCRAENIISLNVLAVHMSNDGIARPKPKVIKPPIAYGKDVKLKCSAIGLVELTWYKSKRNGTRNDWQLINSEKSVSKLNDRTGLRETVRSLVIKKFNVSDNGVYICDLYRYYVNWRAHTEKYVGIKGFQKPKFTNFPEPLITVQLNERYIVYREYTVEGMPNPLITWYKVNGDKEELLSKCNESRCSPHRDVNFGITMNSFDKYSLSFPDDNATFKCVASNFLGSTTKTFRLNVLAKPKIAKKNKEILSFIHVYKEGRERELVCKVEAANPNQISFTWEAQLTGCTNTDCKPNNSKWQVVTGRESGLKIISTNGKSTLTFEKSEQHFFYRCRAINTVGEDYRVWKVVPVTGPQLKPVRSLVEVNETENAELSCTVAWFTPNQVYWSFNNVTLQLGPRMKVVKSSSNTTVYNTLHITKVNVTDAGKYKCFVEFNGNSEAAEIQLKVRELKAPSVSLKNLTRKQSSSFLVRCNVSGHPKPRIIWKKDGEILKVRDSVQGTDDCKSRLNGTYMLLNEDKDHATVLVICKADYKRNLGQFSCTARNRLGNDTAKAFIVILAPPMISAFLPRTKSIVLGEEFFLKCVSSGNPKPRVWWEKKDEKTSMFKRVKNERSDELHFDTLDESNLGDYRCFARNEEKISSRDFKLEPSPVADEITWAPATASNKYPIVIGCVSFFIVAIVIIVAVVLYKRKKAYGGFYILTLPPLPDYIKKLDPHTPLTEQTNKLPYDAEWEFPRDRLKLSRELGSGAFGKVFLADALGIVAFDPRGCTKRRSSSRRFGGSVRRNHYDNNNKMTKVAVKTLKEDSGETEYKDLLSELKILIHVGEHKNIVNLLGACTKGRESELWVIMEFCSNGNLLQFLRNRRDIYETEWKGVSKDPNVQLTMTDLVIAAYQVARGMEFLASRLCIHRDLATRNILVTDNYVIKIADFGLARDVGQDSQYVKTSTGLLPIKWIAIEAIIQRLFTEKSDVWSFGIVLWELFTLGGTPYPNIPPNEVAEFLARGLRMEPPHACPEEISTLMMKCWQEDKDSRPTFKELVEILDKIIGLHTSSEGGRGYLEVQEEVMNEYLSPSEVKTPEMDPFECNSPLPPIPSPGDNENDSLMLRYQNARRGKFRFDKGIGNKGRKDSEIEKMQNGHRPEIIKDPDVKCLRGNELDGYIDTSLTGKEKERIERDLDKDRDSSEEPQSLGDYAYWKKSLV